MQLQKNAVALSEELAKMGYQCKIISSEHIHDLQLEIESQFGYGRISAGSGKKSKSFTESDVDLILLQRNTFLPAEARRAKEGHLKPIRRSAAKYMVSKVCHQYG